MNNHTLVLSDSKIIISGLSLILRQNKVRVLVRSDTIPGYDLSPLNMDELFVNNEDLEKARPIINSYKKQILKDG
ncbi:MAG: hypothetical protein L7S44_04030 [Flavobacteriaceae bacterium]|jgi:hypothetical protein|nr:hypothetical protein [Flavobacteriaceae bacterium]